MNSDAPPTLEQITAKNHGNGAYYLLYLVQLMVMDLMMEHSSHIKHLMPVKQQLVGIMVQMDVHIHSATLIV